MLANEITFHYQVICIDELEIKDITDAMLIMHLFKELFAKGIFIFITTNTIPKDLYKDGIQRESFLPFIQDIYQEFLLLSITNAKDYRYNILAKQQDRIIFPINKQTSKNIFHCFIKTR
jgi:cell division protein ZapE